MEGKVQILVTPKIRTRIKVNAAKVGLYISDYLEKIVPKDDREPATK